jgi:hypothetical protein
MIGTLLTATIVESPWLYKGQGTRNGEMGSGLEKWTVYGIYTQRVLFRGHPSRCEAYNMEREFELNITGKVDL